MAIAQRARTDYRLVLRCRTDSNMLIYLLKLPAELVHQIFSELTLKDLFGSRCVCKTFCKSPQPYEVYISRRWPHTQMLLPAFCVYAQSLSKASQSMIANKSVDHPGQNIDIKLSKRYKPTLLSPDTSSSSTSTWHIAFTGSTCTCMLNA